MSTNEQNPECPLCLELLEMDDVNFFPCTCGYQICRFCWHRIRTDENGLCPACRKQYPEDPADFKPLTPEEMQQIKNEKKQKDIQRKQKISENRKHLSNVRVVQKNLVFVVGLPTRLADSEVLKKCDYFGKFGKILKVIVNQSTSYAGSQGPSASAYVTYHKVEDALRAIQSVNNSKVDGRTLKASLGTTKYCSHFLKKLQCPKQDCMYLHELGDEAASFTKEEMQLGKHQEYEQKLYEQMMNCTNLNRKQISPGDQTDIAQFLQKEKWPSPHSNKEDHRQNGLSESLGYSQSLQTSLKAALDSSVSFRIKHTPDNEHAGCPQEHSADRGLQHHLASHFANSNSIRESYPKSEVDCSNTNCVSTEQIARHNIVKDLSGSCSSASNGFKNANAISNQCASTVHTFEKYSLGNSMELMRQKQQTLSSGTELKKLSFPLQQCQSSSPVPQNTCLPNGILHSGFLPELSLRSREDLKYLTRIPVSSSSKPTSAFSQASQESNYNNSLVHHGNIVNMCPLPQFQHNVPSNHEVLNHSNTMSSSNDYVNNCDSGVEDSFQEVQDDELGFDPWHESSKGLADLMKKEAGERVEANSVLPNVVPQNALEQTTVPSDAASFQNPYPDYTRYLQRMAPPPPGFTANHYGANYMTRPSFPSDAFSNKMMHTINMHNHTSASAPMMHYQQQSLHPQMGVANHIVHVPDSGMRPHTQEFQENMKQTLLQNSVNHSFGLQASQQLPLSIGRTSHKSPHWNNSVPSDMHWHPQEQAMLNQACFTENRPVSPSQWLKMLQQMKLNDGSVRYQNHQVQNSTPFPYKGGST